MTICTDPYCSSMKEHNTGAYNFALFPHEKHRTGKLPSDIRNLLISINSNKRPKPAEHNADDYEILAKFAVVHQSHRKGLILAEITEPVFWKNLKIVEILREGVERQPLRAVDEF